MTLKTTIYEHQNKAVEKLVKLKVGALYMEMGTGKTRTAIELIFRRIERNKIDKVLWLCPCSVKNTIKRELDKHLNNYENIIVIAGIESLSSSVKLNSELFKFVNDFRCMLIVDESNLIKNHKAKRTENITTLSSYCEYKLILNGTPISKNEKDLFSQWQILDWRILGYQSFWSFARNHIEYDEKTKGRIKNMTNVDYLVSKIAPYTYQISKSECLTLPTRTYEKVYYQLTQRQDEHYEDVANALMLEVDEWEPHTIYRLFTGLQNVISGLRVKVDKTLTNTPFFDNPLDNPRIECLIDLIHQLQQKTIIFCKYTHEIKTITNIINDEYGAGTAVEFYGELNQKKRQENLQKFEQKSQFLIANKTCAGYGLNLQFCSYVIYYNNDWDYATRVQSEDRVHRIGQKNNVHYIDICAENTLDERILKCLEKKENLVDSFKKELNNSNDVDTIKKYIYYKNKKGDRKISKIEKENAKAIEELKECDSIG